MKTFLGATLEYNYVYFIFINLEFYKQKINI